MTSRMTKQIPTSIWTRTRSPSAHQRLQISSYVPRSMATVGVALPVTSSTSCAGSRRTRWQLVAREQQHGGYQETIEDRTLGRLDLTGVFACSYTVGRDDELCLSKTVWVGPRSLAARGPILRDDHSAVARCHLQAPVGSPRGQALRGKGALQVENAPLCVYVWLAAKMPLAVPAVDLPRGRFG